jgi:hypothetical protein
MMNSQRAAETGDFLTAHAKLTRDENCAPHTPQVITALKELYIVSSAAAQRGTHALDVRDAQWRALDHETRRAQAVIDQLLPEYQTQAVTLLRDLAHKCSTLLDRRATFQESPAAMWRDVTRLGREAYEYLDLLTPDRA